MRRLLGVLVLCLLFGCVTTDQQDYRLVKYRIGAEVEHLPLAELYGEFPDQVRQEVELCEQLGGTRCGYESVISDIRYQFSRDNDETIFVKVDFNGGLEGEVCLSEIKLLDSEFNTLETSSGRLKCFPQTSPYQAFHIDDFKVNELPAGEILVVHYVNGKELFRKSIEIT